MRLPENIIADGKSLTVYDVAAVALFGHPFEVRIGKGVGLSKRFLDELLAQDYFLYGVNTNYGKDVQLIIKEPLRIPLQENLIRSLLCGAGEPLDEAIVKGMMLARINCLSKGYSAVRPIVIEKLAEALRAGLVPCVPSFGSVGASGDLIPSAYVANFLYGGFASDSVRCHTPGGVMPLREAYRRFGGVFTPIEAIEAKECLSIINSVSFCASMASLVIFRLKRMIDILAVVTAFASQSAKCFVEDFDPYVQALRSGESSGAVAFAKKVMHLNSPSPLLRDAEASRRHPDARVPLQDAYALGRCVSQHLGTLIECATEAERNVNTVLNGVHDNPIVDPYERRVSHSGNFYAGDIASRMDYTRIEIGKAAKYLHALVNRLLDEHKNVDLGANLVLDQDGIQNGFKGLNLLATALATSLSGVVAMSPETMPTERENQDIVSLGFEAAKRAYRDIDTLEYLAAVSLICALQAFDLRLRKEGIAPFPAGAEFNPKLLFIYGACRAVVPFMERDRSLHDAVETLKTFLHKEGHQFPIDQS
ncbi:MAG: aromatic amino acid ammonia-lyase [bacterium]|nr:aromatic amino acid ammonia-lyase [bacterium]